MIELTEKQMRIHTRRCAVWARPPQQTSLTGSAKGGRTVQPRTPTPLPIASKPIDPIVSELYEKLDCLMDIDKLIRKVLVMHEETLALREELNRTIAKIKELP